VLDRANDDLFQAQPATGEAFVDQGQQHYEEQQRQRSIDALRRRATALGFQINSRGEKQFDEQYAGQDWSIDTATGACGAVWREATGRHIIVTVDLGTNPSTGEPSNQFGKYRPIPTATQPAPATA